MCRYNFPPIFLKIKPKKEHFKGIASCIMILAAMSSFILCSPAFAQEFINTKWAKIVYNSPVDLQEMNRKLTVKIPDGFLQQYSLISFPSQNSDNFWLGVKIDALLLKVSAILRLNLQTSPRLTIRLFKDGRQIAQIFSLFQPSSERPLFGYGSMQAFYEPRSRTILLSLKDLREGILAHEMAHFLLCTSNFAPPPEYIQEDLAEQVESRIY
jgi:hypothetical protein